MSETTACVVIVIAVLVFVLLSLIIWRLGRFGGPSLLARVRESWTMFRSAKDATERLYVLWVSSVFLFRGSLGLFLGFLVTIVSGSAIAGVCGRESVVGRIVWDMYERYGRPLLDSIFLSPPTPEG